MRVGRLPSDGNSETIRTTLTLLLSACATTAGAQLVNASFEDGLNGWQVNNYIGSDTVSLTTEPPGGGEQSMAMLTNGYDVAFENQAVQPLGDLPPGTVVQLADGCGLWYQVRSCRRLHRSRYVPVTATEPRFLWDLNFYTPVHSTLGLSIKPA